MASEANSDHSEVVHRKKHHSQHHHGHSSHSQRMEDIQKAALAEEHGGNKSDSRSHPTDHSSPILFTVCFLGIFVSYFVYGLVQEKITRRKFGDQRFSFFMFLVGVQCVINAAFAKTVSVIRKADVSLTPYRLFSVLAFTYVGAMVASNSALSYIAYPTQVLGKSAKPIPILLLGVLVGHRSYPRIKYLIVLLIVTGVALFLYKDGGQKKEDSGQYKLFDIIGIGEFLVIISLTFDGLTGVIQDRLKIKHNVSAHHMMYAVNVFASMYLAMAVFFSGEAVQAIYFVQEHPEVIFYIMLFGLTSAIGQNFIFMTITNFGPLTCSIFTTTRKFFTILASVLIFSNVLIFRQWTGVILVFIGLGLDIVFGKAIKKHHHHHHHSHHSNHHDQIEQAQTPQPV